MKKKTVFVEDVKIMFVIINFKEEFVMKKMVIFDPAMCCSTGVCGPSVDKNLLRVSTILNRLEKKGIKVERHNLSSDPKA